jgi:hypothetical protein
MFWKWISYQLKDSYQGIALAVPAGSPEKQTASAAAASPPAAAAETAFVGRHARIACPDTYRYIQNEPPPII